LLLRTRKTIFAESPDIQMIQSKLVNDNAFVHPPRNRLNAFASCLCASCLCGTLDLTKDKD